MVENVHQLRPKPNDSEKITINLGFVDLSHIDLMVQEGFYSNRTDFIRTAIRNHYGPAHLASLGSRDPLGSLHVSAVMRTRCQTEKAGDLPPVVELAIVDLACHDGTSES
jgi:hypothetical protein